MTLHKFGNWQWFAIIFLGHILRIDTRIFSTLIIDCTWLYLEYLAMVWVYFPISNDDQLVDSVSSFSFANCSSSLVLCFVGVCSVRMLRIQLEYLTIQAETSFSAYIVFKGFQVCHVTPSKECPSNKHHQPFSCFAGVWPPYKSNLDGKSYGFGIPWEAGPLQSLPWYLVIIGDHPQPW